MYLRPCRPPNSTTCCPNAAAAAPNIAGGACSTPSSPVRSGALKKPDTYSLLAASAHHALAPLLLLSSRAKPVQGQAELNLYLNLHLHLNLEKQGRASLRLPPAGTAARQVPRTAS